MPCHCSECCASRKELLFFNLLCSSMSPSRLVLGTLSAKVCRQLHCPRAFFLTGHFYALHVKLHCAVFLYADALSPSLLPEELLALHVFFCRCFFFCFLLHLVLLPRLKSNWCFSSCIFQHSHHQLKQYPSTSLHLFFSFFFYIVFDIVFRVPADTFFPFLFFFYLVFASPQSEVNFIKMAAVCAWKPVTCLAVCTMLVCEAMKPALQGRSFLYCILHYACQSSLYISLAYRGVSLFSSFGGTDEALGTAESCPAF